MLKIYGKVDLSFPASLLVRKYRKVSLKIFSTDKEKREEIKAPCRVLIEYRNEKNQVQEW